MCAVAIAGRGPQLKKFVQPPEYRKGKEEILS